MNRIFLSIILIFISFSAFSATEMSFADKVPSFSIDNRKVLSAPKEGLWSVSTDWSNGWMTNWHHANPSEIKTSGKWTIVNGAITLSSGDMIVEDAYKKIRDGLWQCVRRYNWTGKDTLKRASLSVRWELKGNDMMTFLPGILYYGNKNGATVNKDIIPVYNGKNGEFAIFEEHRYPMPFAMLENKEQLYAAALHSVPSPIKGAVLSDQWWSLGVEAKGSASQLVMYSGPIGYNGQHSVAKALQHKPMPYGDTYLNIEPGTIIEKSFYIELYPIKDEGSAFQTPIYTSMDINKPYYVDRFTTFDEIVAGKYNFAKNRWIELSQDAVGFDMYDLRYRKDLVMGWCGQADTPGYAFQVLESELGDPEVHEMIQKSMDFLSTYPTLDSEGLFYVGYDEKSFYGGDPVSCGQAMYNFAKAIETARKSKKYDTRRWEEFLKKACDNASKRILNPSWNPKSTAEAFYVAPLVISSKLFKNKNYKEAALKCAKLFVDRHIKMNGCYWGGTLDATCEDKEGAWAAFQAFLSVYENYGMKDYLKYAKHAMDVCLSYTVVWDIPLPAGRMADYNFKSTGWTVVSPQNQHIDVYGVLYAPEVYKMGQYLKDNRLKDLSRVMYRSCYQLTNPEGSQGEQLQNTNFAQNGDMSNVHKLRGGYSEHWTVFWITAHFLNAAAKFQEMNIKP